MKAPSQGGLQYVMYVVGAVRLCPKGDPKGLGCSTPKRKRAFDNLVIQRGPAVTYARPAGWEESEPKPAGGIGRLR